MDVVVGLVAFSICIGALVHLVFTDVRKRIIPRKDCYLIALCGSLLQLGIKGLHAWLTGLGFGLVALLFCLSVEKVARRFSLRSNVLGGGDIRLIVALSLASGPYALWGAFGAALAALLWALAGIATSRLSLADTFPMAPCLACWPLASLGISLL